MNPRIVRVDHLPPEGETFDLRFAAAEAAALLRRRGLPDELTVTELSARGRVFPGGDDVFLLGEMQGTLGGACSRCLVSCDQPLSGEFHLTFVRDEGRGEGGENELHREDLDLEPLGGLEIDLGEVVAEQVFLRLPSHPLCREECRGLCPVCGGNRNQVECGCQDGATDPRFAVLESLRRVEPEPEE